MAEDLEYIDRIAGLIIKYHRDELSEEESLELTVWCAQSTKNQALFDQLSDPDFIKGSIRALPDMQSLKKNGWEKVATNIGEEEKATGGRSFRLRPWRPYLVAASISLVLILGAWLYLGLRGRKTVSGTQTAVVHAANDVAPGSSKAVLTLSDGSLVTLDSTGSGTISRQSGAVVMKSPGVVSYAANVPDDNPTKTVYNTLTTPASGQYQVVLPDGSRVWLNNASSLRYPVSFDGARREVELEGEAYFEIAKNVTQPFFVQVRGGLSVEVLGTSFNIEAYRNEAVVKTTLVAGGLRLAAGAVQLSLQPGEQADAGDSLNGGLHLVKDADAEGAIAWKNGKFYFYKADLQAVMRMIARWYDIKVKYDGSVAPHLFGGEIERSLNLSQVLNILAKNGVHFELQGRTLIVRP